MKLFKNRGDIYFSKSTYKSSTEERVLLILLAVIIVFTLVFSAVLFHKYPSAKAFFAGDEVTTTEDSGEALEEELPQISGKRNFLVIETDRAKSVIHYAFLVQADRDNKAYKVCTLSPDMVVDGDSITDIYKTGAGAALQTRLTQFLSIDIDYYAAFTCDDFISFVNRLGTFVYPSGVEVKFNDRTDDDSYAVRLSKGDEHITGTELSSLLRYYSNEDVNFDMTNQIIIYALTGLFNGNNFDNIQSLFRSFINSSQTNITVRNFQDNMDALEVFCKKNTDITVYSVKCDFNDDNSIVPESAQQIKSYFTE